MEIKLIVGAKYAVSTDSVCRVTYMRDGQEREYTTAYAGQQGYFVAQSSVAYVDDENADITLFTDAPSVLVLLRGGGNTDGLPAGYTRVEYLERKRGTGAWIDTKLSVIHLGFRITFAGTDRDDASGSGCMLFGIEAYNNGGYNYRHGVIVQGNTIGNGYNAVWITGTTQDYLSVYDNNFGAFGVVELNYVEGFVYVKGEKQEKRKEVKDETADAQTYLPAGITAGLFSRQSGGIKAAARVYSFEANYNGVPAANYIPALDVTGTPCMFDTVTHTTFYNNGTDDFLYPGKEETATTYSLRRPRMYAQMTPHGIRRLYHVPKGYNGTPEEYAAEHGFKVLVETEQPAEGYWAPVWHEREDCIELEWVETEPPTEQELLTETE